MVTEGIIKSISQSDNTCTVRIPVFETAQMTDEVILKARIITQPGIYNGYKIDDLVWLTFEQDRFHYPIVLGKLVNSTLSELNCSGAVNCGALHCSDVAELPINTKLSGTLADADFKSIAAMGNAITRLNAMIAGNISAKVIDSSYKLLLSLTGQTVTYSI